MPTSSANFDSKLQYLANKESTHKAASLSIQRTITGKSNGCNFENVLHDIKNNAASKNNGEEKTESVSVVPKSAEKENYWASGVNFSGSICRSLKFLWSKCRSLKFL